MLENFENRLGLIDRPPAAVRVRSECTVIQPELRYKATHLWLAGIGQDGSTDGEAFWAADCGTSIGLAPVVDGCEVDPAELCVI
jgi:hypothetical protein